MSDEELKELEYFSGLLLTDTELDDIMQLDPGTIARAVSNVASPVGRIVRAGRLRTRCELYDSILTTARRHSTPAQQMANDMLRKLDAQ
jgi:hypothetical protein